MINNDFVKKYENLIRSTIYGMNIKDKDTVDNLFADAIIRLLEGIHNFDEDKSSISTWVVMHTRSVVSNYIVTINRSEDVMDNQRVSMSDTVPGSNTTRVEHIPDESISEADRHRIYEEFLLAISDLPTIQQKALKLKLVLGYSHNEVAETLGISGSNARAIISRATKKLKRRARVEQEPRWFWGDGVTLQDFYNPIEPIYKFPFKFRVVEGKTWRQVQELIDLPINVLEHRVNVARDMIFKKWNVEV